MSTGRQSLPKDISNFQMQFEKEYFLIKDENLQPGRILEIKHGNFKGHKAEVVEIKNKTYVVMNLPMMGQQARTEIKIEDLGLEEGWNNKWGIWGSFTAVERERLKKAIPLPKDVKKRRQIIRVIAHRL
jgi:hypothetical protein